MLRGSREVGVAVVKSTPSHSGYSWCYTRECCEYPARCSGAFPCPACLRRWVEVILSLSRCVPARLPLGASASGWSGEVDGTPLFMTCQQGHAGTAQLLPLEKGSCASGWGPGRASGAFGRRRTLWHRPARCVAVLGSSHTTTITGGLLAAESIALGRRVCWPRRLVLSSRPSKGEANDAAAQPKRVAAAAASR